MESSKHVVVLGAGVIGLTTALFLAEAGYQVTIIAAHFPGDHHADYTSPWAGAHWRTHAAADEPRECGWDVETFQYWSAILKEEEKDDTSPPSGLKFYPSLYLHPSTPSPNTLWWTKHVPTYTDQPLTSSSVSPFTHSTIPADPPITSAATYTSIALDPDTYLQYLLHRATHPPSHPHQSYPAATTVRTTFPLTLTLPNLLRHITTTLLPIPPSADPPIFINALGLASGSLCNDSAVHGSSGITVLVRGEAKQIVTRVGAGKGEEFGLVVPRPGTGTTILGGTRVVLDGEKVNGGEVDGEVVKRIVARGEILAPELKGTDGQLEVLGVQMGIRPGRKGGARVEKEVVKGWKAVHAYGHSGAGYQNSVGSAREVVRLVKKFEDVADE